MKLRELITLCPRVRLTEQSARGKSAATLLKFLSGVPMRFFICVMTIVVALLIPTAISAAANPPADLEARRKLLGDLLHDRWEYTMRTSPIYASVLGDKRYNDKADDLSQKAIDDVLGQARRALERFQPADTTAFPEQKPS